MAFIPITKEHIDSVTLEMHPKREFSSSSINGITGSVYVYANRSSVNRQRFESSPFESYAVDDNLETIDYVFKETAYSSEFENLVLGNETAAEFGTTDRSFAYSSYLDKVNSAKVSPELNKFMEIYRFKPSFSFTSNTLRKNTVKDVLYKYYSGKYPQLDWAYTNYNCLTFFTSSTVSSNSALIYPAPCSGKTNNQYISNDAFSVSFWVNPRRTTAGPLEEYKAGTIMHISSSLAISIVSGSEKDDFGRPEAFRVLMQVSQSADNPPSNVDLSVSNNSRSYPNDLTFLSKDNSLKLNNWHHVTISWDSLHNFGTGSIYIDNDLENKNNFLIASSSINDSHLTDFCPLIIGNFYDGPNGGSGNMNKFFNAGAAAAEGVENRGPAIGEIIEPSTLSHKPNVDVHDIRIYNKYLSDSEREDCISTGPRNLDNLLFYLPTFFVKESPNRTLLKTPYLTKVTSSSTPFNVDLSYGVGGYDVNLENFTRDFVNKIYPRHFCLTASAVTADTLYATANEINWEKGDYSNYFRTRQLFLLPNDNGSFTPNFELLQSGNISPRPVEGSETDRFVNDLGNLDYSLVSLRNLISTASAAAFDPGANYDLPIGEKNDIATELAGGSLYDPANPRLGVDNLPYELTVLQRTMDNSSNELYFFDISNLFYGNKILPGSFVIEDTSLTGSSGGVGIKVKDNSQGNLYRADSLTPHATWSSVGNILYEEGIAVIKSANIPLFGQEQFKISFTGLHNVHTYEVNVILSPNLFTSSSNPTFKGGKPDDFSNDALAKYVAFNSIQLHDDNLNVITRTNLAQPIIKKIGDKYLVRIKIDY